MAVHCGQRHYLHDDVGTVRLNPKLIASPPIELCPSVQARKSIPPDVQTVLLDALRGVAINLGRTNRQPP